MRGTTVVSSDFEQAAFVLDDSPWSLVDHDLDSFDRVSYFDCPPERLGLDLGRVEFGEIELIPDTALGADPAPLPIVEGLVVSAQGPFDDYTEVIETADVSPDCTRGTFIISRKDGARRHQWMGPDGLLAPAEVEEHRAVETACLDILLLDTPDAMTLVAGDVTIALPRLLPTNGIYATVDCSAPYPRVGLAGEDRSRRMYVVVVDLPSSGFSVADWSIGEPGDGTPAAVMAFDPLERSRILAWERRGADEESLFEIRDSGVRALDGFARAVGPYLLEAGPSGSWLGRPSGRTELTVCGRPNDRLVDLARLPGRWLYATAAGVVGESAVLSPCLTDQVVTRIAPLRSRLQLLVLPLGALVTESTDGTPYLRVRGWISVANEPNASLVPETLQVGAVSLAPAASTGSLVHEV